MKGSNVCDFQDIYISVLLKTHTQHTHTHAHDFCPCILQYVLRTDRRGKENVKMKAYIRVIWPHAKECQ